MARFAVLILAAVAALTGLAGCTTGDDSADRSESPHRIGPQGATGQFLVECELSHQLFDDPIVKPGRPGESHHHLFFGNRDVDAYSDYDGVAGATTSCDQQLDTASYWAPALLDARGTPVEPNGLTAYYRTAVGIDPSEVVAYPPGLMMVAGDQHATSEQSTSVVGWSCRAGRSRQVEPPGACSSALVLSVTFPDCWDGVDIDSDDHISHVAYSDGGGCPSEHPVPIPQLEIVIDYPVAALSGDGGEIDVELASGGVLTGHADFWNVWDQDKLETEVATCLHRDLVCGVSDRLNR